VSFICRTFLTHCNALQHTLQRVVFSVESVIDVFHSYVYVWRVAFICMTCLTHCNALQYTATHCDTLQHTATHYMWHVIHMNATLQVTETCHMYMCDVSYIVCCSVLQCVAVCCSVLQCVAVCCSVFSFICMTCFSHIWLMLLLLFGNK